MSDARFDAARVPSVRHRRGRRIRLLTIGVAATAIAAACSGGGGGSTSGTSAAGGSGSAGSTAGANPNGILRYGYDFSAQFTNLDPGKSTGDCDAIADQPIYDTLVHRDLGGNLLPGLATSWDISGNTLTLHLRPNVTFSDGEPFNAAAVVTGLQHNAKNTS